MQISSSKNLHIINLFMSTSHTSEMPSAASTKISPFAVLALVLLGALLVVALLLSSNLTGSQNAIDTSKPKESIESLQNAMAQSLENENSTLSLYALVLQQLESTFNNANITLEYLSTNPEGEISMTATGNVQQASFSDELAFEGNANANFAEAGVSTASVNALVKMVDGNFYFNIDSLQGEFAVSPEFTSAVTNKWVIYPNTNLEETFSVITGMLINQRATDLYIYEILLNSLTSKTFFNNIVASSERTIGDQTVACATTTINSTDETAGGTLELCKEGASKPMYISYTISDIATGSTSTIALTISGYEQKNPVALPTEFVEFENILN